jgi:Protein of unknown function (DUF3052)
MSEWSGTPLSLKLGIKPGFRVRLVSVPQDVRSSLDVALSKCVLAYGGHRALDLVIVFSKTRPGLSRELGRAATSLAPSGAVWVGWPKKASGVESDLHDGKVRELGLRAGLVDVKVCSINETWSGLKFVRRLADRRPIRSFSSVQVDGKRSRVS